MCICMIEKAFDLVAKLPCIISVVISIILVFRKYILPSILYVYNINLLSFFEEILMHEISLYFLIFSRVVIVEQYSHVL